MSTGSAKPVAQVSQNGLMKRPPRRSSQPAAEFLLTNDMPTVSEESSRSHPSSAMGPTGLRARRSCRRGCQPCSQSRDEGDRRRRQVSGPASLVQRHGACERRRRCGDLCQPSTSGRGRRGDRAVCVRHTGGAVKSCNPSLPEGHVAACLPECCLPSARAVKEVEP